MAREYLSVSGECETIKIIEKSKFITTSTHVESEEEARAFIQRISKKYSDATHNCYAFVSDTLGNMLRFSDDGEPSGTAGMPILDVIRNKKLYQTCVVVTRYFGGIKLGAGGLVRAYSGSTSENLLEAKKLLYTPCVRLSYAISYANADILNRYLLTQDCSIISIEYDSEVLFTIAVKEVNESNFHLALIDRLNGRVELIERESFIFGFDVK